VDVLADSAYGTGDMLAALASTGHTPVIKPWPLRPAVEGGFTLDDFTVDEVAGTSTCPNGITRKITDKRRVTFGAASTGCPLRDRRPSSKWISPPVNSAAVRTGSRESGEASSRLCHPLSR
jgi:hypothetical protein